MIKGKYRVPYCYWSKKQHGGDIVQECRENSSNKTKNYYHGPHSSLREPVSLQKKNKYAYILRDILW